MTDTLPCLTQFTLFPLQYYSTNNTDSLIYNAVSPHECQAICYENNTCGGFNYNGLQLQCIVLFTDTFSLSYLEKTFRYATGFYMKSYTECYQLPDTVYITFIALFCILLIISFPMCITNLRRRSRNRLISRTNSRTSLLSRDQIPPPYQSPENSSLNSV